VDQRPHGVLNDLIVSLDPQVLDIRIVLACLEPVEQFNQRWSARRGLPSSPAVIETPMLGGLSQQHVDYMIERIPMGRMGRADEVAALICWLASEECSFSTGATYDISGGRAVF
jgi:hypothetical protein